MSHSKKPFVFEHVTFYPAAFEMTEAKFIEHESHHGLTEAQLKEAYALGTGAKKDEKKK